MWMEKAATSVVEGPSITAVPSTLPVTSAVSLRKSRLDALTGMRALAALNIVFFHFSNPKNFGPLAPVVDTGYVSVSFFLLLSGFVLAYNYRERAERGQMRAKSFWLTRFSRIYPVFLFSLVISGLVLRQEWQSRSQGQFAAGVGLTLLLAQGWSPSLCTFWNTPAWTLTTDVFFYALFPFVIRWRRPATRRRALCIMLGWWAASAVLPLLYWWFNPDGDPHPDRYSDGWWLRAIKFAPLQHVPSFLFGMALASFSDFLPERSRLRTALGVTAFAALYAIMCFGSHMPYVFMHDGMLMPLYGMVVLGLAGQNLLARLLSLQPLKIIGEASYCLYILHFNLWMLLHDDLHLIARAGLERLDPWLSYLVLVLVAIGTMYLVERPGQRWVKQRLGLSAPVMSPSVP
jgi:peptidoglycan/LPS O-acetylase OafA/YrhL